MTEHNEGMDPVPGSFEEPLEPEGHVSKEEQRDVLLMTEQDVLDEMLGLAKEQPAESMVIDVVSKQGRRIFFRVGPLDEDTDTALRRKCTTYERKIGMRMPKETDVRKYRSLQIVEATTTFCVPAEVDDDRNPIGFRDLGTNMWRSKELREQLGVRDVADVVDAVLLPGQKDEVLAQIERLSGYGESDDPEAHPQVELAKN